MIFMARVRAAIKAFHDPDLVVEALEMRDTILAVEHGETARLTVARIGGKPHPVVLRDVDDLDTTHSFLRGPEFLDGRGYLRK